MKKIILISSLFLFVGCITQRAPVRVQNNPIMVQNNPNPMIIQDNLYTVQRKAFMNMPNAVKKGMTKAEVIVAWSVPQERNKTTTSFGLRDQWVYKYDFKNINETAYVYFEDGIVTEVQN